MHELVYASAARKLLNPGELQDILTVSRRNNARLGISGILLYHEGSFFQVLEGEHDPVRELFARIARDPRHASVAELRSRAVLERSFGGWTMGFVSLDPFMVRGLPGRHALSSNGTLRDDQEAVLALLDRFRAGEYRRYILA